MKEEVLLKIYQILNEIEKDFIPYIEPGLGAGLYDRVEEIRRLLQELESSY